MINLDDREPNKPNVPFTSYQKEVIDSTEDKIVVNATAGSGKSAMLTQLVFNEKGPVLYLAYNKSIVEDIRHKLPSNCEVSTFHAFGLKLIRNNTGKYKVDFNKYSKIDRTHGVADLAQKHISMGGAMSQSKWEETCDRFHIDKDLIFEARQCFTVGQDTKEIVSAEDMISLPVRENYRSEPYSMVLVDECGDLSIDKMMLLSSIPSERIVLVGDRNQQINQYAGSDPDVFNKLNYMYEPAEFSINETFRCSDQVIIQAKKFVPEIFGKKKGGLATRMEIEEIDFSTLPKESLVICRSNAPLFIVARELIKNRIDFKIKPNAINKLKAIIKKLSKRTTNLRTIKDMCNTAMEEEVFRYRQNKWNHEIPKQKYKAVMAILNSGSNLSEVGTFVSELLARSKSKCKLELSTIHSSKGLERKNVFFLHQKISDKIIHKSNCWWEVEAEKNAQFVAITRSLMNLTFLD